MDFNADNRWQIYVILFAERKRERERLKRNLDRSRDYFYSITISRDINDGVKGNNGWPTGVSIGG